VAWPGVACGRSGRARPRQSDQQRRGYDGGDNKLGWQWWRHPRLVRMGWEKGARRARVSVGREGRSGVHFGGRRDVAVEVGRASAMVGRELVHGRCVGISMNT
jgi:hypothetical protein